MGLTEAPEARSYGTSAMTNAIDEHDVAWGRLAQTLSLTPWERAQLEATESFTQLERSLLRPSTPPITKTAWLAGTWNGSRCIVAYDVVRSGKHTHTYTNLWLELSRPMLLGLTVNAKYLADEMAGRSQVVLGPPLFDQKVRVAALDPVRTRALFLQDQNDQAFLERIFQLTRQDAFRITDSFVRLRFGGLLTSPEQIAKGLEDCRLIANELCRRREKVSTTRDEGTVRTEWRTIAEAHRAHFDAPRMRVVLPSPAGESSVFLEAIEQQIGSCVSVRFSRALPYPLLVRRGGGWLDGLFGEDLQIGDREVDPLYIIRSAHPAWAKHFLAAPVRCKLLAKIAAVSEFSAVTDSRVYWTLPRPILTGPELSAHLGLASEVAGAFAGT